MTKKNYVVGAKILKNALNTIKLEKFTGEQAFWYTMGAIACMFKEDNPRFNKEKFWTAIES